MKELGTVVKQGKQSEPTQEEVDEASVGACFDRMSAEEQQAVLKAVGSMEAIRSNPYFNDCR